jgi:integrase
MAKENVVRGSVISKHGSWHWKRYEEGKQTTTALGRVRDVSKSDAVKEANKRAAEQLPKNARGPKMLVVDFADNIFFPFIQKKCKAATVDGYNKIWKTHLKDHFSDAMLHEYEPWQASELLTKLAKGGMGRHALSHVRALMSNVFAHAVGAPELKGAVKANPIHGAKIRAAVTPPPETPHYSIEEMRAVLTALQDKPQACAVMALCFLGLRPAELRGLAWGDIDTEQGIIHVRRSMWRKHVSDGGKRKNSKRDITFGPLVAAILEDYRRTLEVQGSYVFDCGTGNPLDLHLYATRVIRPALTEKGAPWKSFYAGRRGAVTEMLRYTNGNTQLTAPYFGHTKAVADGYYAKGLPEETKKAALALDSALNEVQQGTASA